MSGEMTMTSEIRLLIWRRQSWFTFGFCPGIRLERDGEKTRSPRKLVNEVWKKKLRRLHSSTVSFTWI